MAAIIDIATYNLLANSMIKFVKSDHLALETRWPLIEKVIRQMIEENTIINLQEVDRMLWRLLEPVFASTGYTAKTSFYSTMSERDGMGNVIAYPTAKYDILASSEIAIGKTIKIPENVPVETFAKPNIPKNIPDNVYTEAMKRDVTLVGVLLKDKESSKVFWSFTYHMPCTFWWIPVTILHIAALKKTMREIAGTTPFVLALDANSNRGTSHHQFLMSGTITDDAIKPYPTWIPTDDEKYPLVDSRRYIDDIADDATTQCKNGNGEEFCGCIDYILSSGWENRMIIATHAKHQTSPNMPNEEHGSDHIPLFARIARI